jgi:membrane associated rhomboid family serine protease
MAHDLPAASRLRRDEGGGVLAPVLWLLAAMWVAEVLDAALPVDLDAYGIHPRDTDGLLGVALFPFLHAGFGHLLANTVPFFVLGALVAADGRRAFWRATLIIIVVGGVGTWAIGHAQTVVVGASGVVFGYLTYLVARAYYVRRALHLVIASVVLFLYGGLLFGVLPGVPGVSWQAHLMGAVAGVVAARATRSARRSHR